MSAVFVYLVCVYLAVHVCIMSQCLLCVRLRDVSVSGVCVVLCVASIMQYLLCVCSVAVAVELLITFEIFCISNNTHLLLYNYHVRRINALANTLFYLPNVPRLTTSS